MALCSRAPLIPVTVSVNVPGVADADTVTVSVDVIAPSEGGVTEVGVKIPVASIGRPEIERLTSDVNPFKDVIVMVELAELFRAMDRDVGEAATVKSGGAVTVRAIVVL